jgi:PilZ domain
MRSDDPTPRTDASATPVDERRQAADQSPAPKITEGVAGGRPRVFGLEGRVIPLPSDGGSSLEHGIDVALLMAPRPDEPFSIRTPRGALASGGHFVLRCKGIEGQRGALARATAVSELGIQFDVVTAEMVQSSETSTHQDPGAASVDRARANRSQVPSQAHTPDPRVDDGLLQRTIHRERLKRHASASAVEIGGVTTIGFDVSTTLFTPVHMGEPVKLAAPRGEIPRGAYFSLRYFDASGAKRGIVRAETVQAQPGMLDEIEATLIRLPTAAEERQSYRASFECYFTADVLGDNGTRTVRGRITDLSAVGIGFRVTSNLVPGERMRIADPLIPDLDGAELVITRRDPRDTQRYGARFVKADRGATALATILGLDRAEREHRRRIQIEEIRRTRGATAAPLTAADIESLRNRRMGTRSHGAKRPHGESSDR